MKRFYLFSSNGSDISETRFSGFLGIIAVEKWVLKGKDEQGFSSFFAGHIYYFSTTFFSFSDFGFIVVPESRIFGHDPSLAHFPTGNRKISARKYALKNKGKFKNSLFWFKNGIYAKKKLCTCIAQIILPKNSWSFHPFSFSRGKIDRFSSANFFFYKKPWKCKTLFFFIL